jgi:hypothetical protein
MGYSRSQIQKTEGRWKESIMKGWIFVLSIGNCKVDDTESEMSWSCSTHGRYEKCIQNFNWRI